MKSGRRESRIADSTRQKVARIMAQRQRAQEARGRRQRSQWAVWAGWAEGWAREHPEAEEGAA